MISSKAPRREGWTSLECGGFSRGGSMETRSPSAPRVVARSSLHRAAKSSDVTSAAFLEAALNEVDVEPLNKTPKERKTHFLKDDSVPESLLSLPPSQFENGNGDELLKMYRSLLGEKRLKSGLYVLQRLIEADRTDVVGKVWQKEFLNSASSQKAVKLATAFVEMLPIEFVDRRTYNMLASVCVQARDIDGALLAAKLMQKRGFETDLPMYTNLIVAYGACGDVHGAFQKYAELKEADLIPDCTVASALASLCASRMKEAKSGDRRGNLVLLERANNLLQDLNRYNVAPDTKLWNVLVTCAGRAGQVQRAFDILQEMKSKSCKADCVTYASLIDACVKAKQRDVAQKVYQLAIKEITHPKVSLYTVALEACMCGSSPVDADAAFEIYRQAERSGSPLDAHFFSTMMRVAGKAGMPDLALSIEDNMRIQGIEQSSATCSSLISAALASDDLKLAMKIYDSMTSKSIYPNLYQFTNLMQAHAKLHHFGNMVRLVEDMVMNDIKPDDVTCDILLSAFKDASMADLAFAVFTLLKGKGMPVTERICYSMLDICHIQIKAMRGVVWVKPGIKKVSASEGNALLKALSGDKAAPDVQSVSLGVWTDRSIAIYRSALSGGVLPSLELLSKALCCLRVPHVKCREENSALDPINFNPYAEMSLDDILSDHSHRKRESESCFDKRAMQLIKEAISVELVPPFCLNRQGEMVLSGLPPAVAEAYVFTIMEMLKFHHKRRSYYGHTVLFKVHPFDPRKALLPSAAWNSLASDEQNNKGKAVAGEGHRLSQGKNDECTSLAVVAVLRRMGLWHSTIPQNGIIIISPRDITTWMYADEHEQDDSSVKGGRYKSPFSAKLASQQHDIRIMNEGFSSFDSDYY